MITRLVLRSAAQRPVRTALLLAGYGLGVGVTVALLSIATALLEQARDRDLVGGGDLTVLPAGLDLETFKTGGASSMYFTIEQAPFLYREAIRSGRYRSEVRSAAPWIDDALLYVRLDGEYVPVAASGEIPSLSASLGVAPALSRGRWEDLGADRDWQAADDSTLYARLDRFHRPPPGARGDSTWAEWHYFNILLPEDRGWLYLTYMVAGDVEGEEWGGRMSATWVETEAGASRERTFQADVEAARVEFSLERPDLRIGPSEVGLASGGRYDLLALVPAADGSDTLRAKLSIRAGERRYVPPLEVGGDLVSGYTVPILDGRADGEICTRRGCEVLREAPAYHDHNWGTWRDVTWDWGTLRAGPYALVYGGVLQNGAPAGSRFLFLTDSLGFRQILDIEEISYEWGSYPAGERSGPRPSALRLLARSGLDSLVLAVRVAQVRETSFPGGEEEEPRTFFQLHGAGRLSGSLGRMPIEADGEGFFETWSTALDLPPAAGVRGPRSVAE